MRNKIIVLMALLCFLPRVAMADLTVYFLDVGQGDSAIVECDGNWMMIDGGLKGQSQKIYSFLENSLKVDRLKYVVATHPDRDHIGGLAAALEAVKKVEHVFSPVDNYNSDRFEDLKNYTEKHGLKKRIEIPFNKDTFYLGEAKIMFFNSEKKAIL